MFDLSQTRFEIYVSKRNKEIFDQIIALANINCVPISTIIAEACDRYTREINKDPKLIIDRKFWDGILDKCDKEELLHINRLILKLNEKVLKRL